MNIHCLSHIQIDVNLHDDHSVGSRAVSSGIVIEDNRLAASLASRRESLLGLVSASLSTRRRCRRIMGIPVEVGLIKNLSCDVATHTCARYKTIFPPIIWPYLIDSSPDDASASIMALDSMSTSSSPSSSSSYTIAIVAFAVSAVIDAASTPLLVISQAFFFSKLKVS